MSGRKMEQPPSAKEQTRNVAGFTIRESGASAGQLFATCQLLPSAPAYHHEIT